MKVVLGFLGELKQSNNDSYSSINFLNIFGKLELLSISLEIIKAGVHVRVRSFCMSHWDLVIRLKLILSLFKFLVFKGFHNLPEGLTFDFDFTIFNKVKQKLRILDIKFGRLE